MLPVGLPSPRSSSSQPRLVRWVWPPWPRRQQRGGGVGGVYQAPLTFSSCEHISFAPTPPTVYLFRSARSHPCLKAHQPRHQLSWWCASACWGAVNLSSHHGRRRRHAQHQASTVASVPVEEARPLEYLLRGEEGVRNLSLTLPNHSAAC